MIISLDPPLHLGKVFLKEAAEMNTTLWVQLLYSFRLVTSKVVLKKDVKLQCVRW